MNRITINIYDGKNWAYAVHIDKGLHTIGYAPTYKEVIKLVTKDVKSAQNI